MDITSKKPKIVHGAFVEYGISLPPLIVFFQFNPLQLTRNRSLSYSAPDAQKVENEGKIKNIGPSMKEYHRKTSDLAEIQKNQVVDIDEESIGFELRLDGTDAGNSEAGIAPQLAVLEQMIYPKEEGVLGQLLSKQSFCLSKKPNPPMILFIWGLHRILPVNIKSMNITETEFNMLLNPIRATVSVNLEVIEGYNTLNLYTQVNKEIMALRNIANTARQVMDIFIP